MCLSRFDESLDAGRVRGYAVVGAALASGFVDTRGMKGQGRECAGWVPPYSRPSLRGDTCDLICVEPGQHLAT